MVRIFNFMLRVTWMSLDKRGGVEEEEWQE